MRPIPSFMLKLVMYQQHLRLANTIQGALLCAVCILSASCVSNSPKTASTLKLGNYLFTDYMNSVKRNHSAFHSLNPDIPSLVIVRKGEKGVQFQEIVNFHEGDAKFEISPSNEINHIEGRDTSNLKLTIQSKSRFTICYGDGPAHRFEWIGPEKWTLFDGRKEEKSVDAWVAKHTIAGTYTDERGYKYIFGTDGRAIFPDKTFSYTVKIDPVPHPIDGIYGKGFCWAFKIESDVLSLFNASDLFLSVDEKPFLVLHKVSHKTP